MQDLIDKELLKFEPPEEKPSVMQNPRLSHGNDNASPSPSSNAVNGQKVMFDPSQLITPRGARVQVRFEEEGASPEIAMVAHDKQKLTKRGKMSHQQKTKLKGHLELVPPSR